MTTVTQMVREAAAAAAAHIDGYCAAVDGIRAGRADAWPLVQAFATFRQAVLEEAAKVADEHVQRARSAVAECAEGAKWSPAQAEWSRARDLGLDIAEALSALAADTDTPAQDLSL